MVLHRETQVVSHATAWTEAAWITADFQRLHRGGMPWSEMAVLFRTNQLTRCVEDQMVPFVVPPPPPFQAAASCVTSHPRVLMLRHTTSAAYQDYKAGSKPSLLVAAGRPTSTI